MKVLFDVLLSLKIILNLIFIFIDGCVEDIVYENNIRLFGEYG